jgi:hypothetical protein
MHQQNPNPMEWHYYTNKATKRKIDHLLFEAAKLFANCESTYEARQEGSEDERARVLYLKSTTLTHTLPKDAVIILEVGKVPSLNSFYASKHWIVRKKAKDKFKAELLEQLRPVRQDYIQASNC